MQEKDDHKFKSIFKKIIPSESKSIAGEHYLVLCGHEHRFANSNELTFHNIMAGKGQKSYNLITLNHDPNEKNVIEVKIKYPRKLSRLTRKKKDRYAT